MTKVENMNYIQQLHGTIPVTDIVINWKCLLARTEFANIIIIIKFSFLYGFLNVQTVVTDLMEVGGGRLAIC
jgi:hypothetical protein